MKFNCRRLAQGSTVAGIGGLSFHAFHGPEHLMCLAAAGLLTLLGSVAALYPRRKKRPELEDSPHNEVKWPKG